MLRCAEIPEARGPGALQEQGYLQSGTRCKRCPVVWKRLAGQGFAEREAKLHYVVIDVVPKRTSSPLALTPLP